MEFDLNKIYKKGNDIFKLWRTTMVKFRKIKPYIVFDKQRNKEILTRIVALSSPKQVLYILNSSLVLNFQSFMLDQVKPKHNKIIVLPCAASKVPSYKSSRSLSYKTLFNLQKKYNSFDIYTISEPLGLHPSDWIWVSDYEWEPKLQILPFYNVTGLFKRIKKEKNYYQASINKLGSFVKKYVERNYIGKKWLFLVKPHKSHGDMVKNAFNLKTFKDGKITENIFLLGEKVLDKKIPQHIRSYNFVKIYEKEIINFTKEWSGTHG